jgi:hypothetical protein
MRTKISKELLLSLIVVVVLFMTGCQKDKNIGSLDNPKISSDLPSAVQQQIDLSVANLSKYLGDKLQVVAIDDLGELSAIEQTQTKSAVSEQSNFIAIGNILYPSTVKIGEMQEIYSDEMLKSTKAAIDDTISQEVKASDKVMKITWKYDNKTYTTKCYYRESGIVWDNVISGLYMMDTIPQKTSGSDKGSKNLKSTNTTYSDWYKEWWTASWLWGSKRGEIGYQITIYYSGTTVSSTDAVDWGYISLGSAKSESKVIHNSGSYGQIRYALGLCTPLGSLSFNSSTFKVSFSGIGSNIVCNGTKTLYP